MKLNLAGWRRLFRLWRADPAADVDAELRFHFEQKVADLVARGLSPDEARARAEGEFGDVDAVRSNLRRIDDRIAHQKRRADWWESIVQDVGYVLRSLRRSPGFTMMVALILALGLGANAALFAVLDRLYTRPPAGVGDPGHVRRMYQQYRDKAAAEPQVRSVFSPPEVRELIAAAPKPALVTGYYLDHENLGRGADAPEVVTTYVAGDYFGVLGVRPALGRFFAADEYRMEGLSAVAVISHKMWLERFGGTHDVLGAAVDLGSRRYTIIGVVPTDFIGVDLNASDLWLPANAQGPWKGRNAAWMNEERSFRTRLAMRVPSTVDARAMVRLASTIFRKVGAGTDTTAFPTLVPISEALDTGFGGKQLLLATRLGGVAAIVLLIACANVANLLLARGMQRRREIAVRLALGVSRKRLLGLLLTESMVVALIAGVASLLVAWWTATALRHALLPTVTWGELAINGRVAAFAIGVAALAGLGAGLAPALRSSRADVTVALKGNSRGGTYQRSRLRTGLLIAQAALSLVLIAAAGLLVKSLHGVESIDIGFASDRLVFATIQYDRELDSHDQAIANQLPAVAERLRALPDIEGVAISSIAPMRGFSWEALFLPDRDSIPKLGGMLPFYSTVSSEYFATTGIRLLKGRTFAATDRVGTDPVLIVSQALAATFWPGQDPLEKCIIMVTRTDPCRRIVGVAADAHWGSVIEKPSMMVYVPTTQANAGYRGNALTIRARPGSTRRVEASAARAIVESLGSWAVPRMLTMTKGLDDDLRPWRLGAALFAGAGLLSLLVAALGVYGTLAYTISQRSQEMSVRVALGARTNHILALVIGEGLRTVVIGVVVGVALALALGRVVTSMLYDTSAYDPAVLTLSVLVLLAVAGIACVIPAWRASRADPNEALRAE